MTARDAVFTLRGTSIPRSGRRLIRVRREWLGSYLYLLPALVPLAIFAYYPLVFLLNLSLHRLDTASPTPTWIGLANYRELFASELFYRVLLNTAVYTALMVPLSVGVGLALAVALNQKLVATSFLRTLFYTPVVMPTVAAATLALWIFNSNYGLVNHVLVRLGLRPVEWVTSSELALPTIVAVGVWKTFGYFTLVYLAALQALPQSVLEAARLDGARPWARFWTVTWPLLRPTTWFAIVIAVILSFQAFDFVNIMTQGGPSNATNLLVFSIYQYGFQYFRLGLAAALAVVMFVLAYALSGLLTWAYNR